MQDAWTRSVLPAVKERSIPVATLLAEASPSELEGDTLTLSFRPGAEFHRTQAEEPATHSSSATRSTTSLDDAWRS